MDVVIFNDGIDGTFIDLHFAPPYAIRITHGAENDFLVRNVLPTSIQEMHTNGTQILSTLNNVTRIQCWLDNGVLLTVEHKDGMWRFEFGSVGSGGAFLGKVEVHSAWGARKINVLFKDTELAPKLFHLGQLVVETIDKQRKTE